MLKVLVKLANRLDSLGLTKEADVIDGEINKVASEFMTDQEIMDRFVNTGIKLPEIPAVMPRDLDVSVKNLNILNSIDPYWVWNYFEKDSGANEKHFMNQAESGRLTDEQIDLCSALFTKHSNENSPRNKIKNEKISQFIAVKQREERNARVVRDLSLTNAQREEEERKKLLEQQQSILDSARRSAELEEIQTGKPVPRMSAYELDYSEGMSILKRFGSLLEKSKFNDAVDLFFGVNYNYKAFIIEKLSPAMERDFLYALTMNRGIEAKIADGTFPPDLFNKFYSRVKRLRDSGGKKSLWLEKLEGLLFETVVVDGKKVRRPTAAGRALQFSLPEGSSVSAEGSGSIRVHGPADEPESHSFGKKILRLLNKRDRTEEEEKTLERYYDRMFGNSDVAEQKEDVVKSISEKIKEKRDSFLSELDPDVVQIDTSDLMTNEDLTPLDFVKKNRYYVLIDQNKDDSKKRAFWSAVFETRDISKAYELASNIEDTADLPYWGRATGRATIWSSDPTPEGMTEEEYRNLPERISTTEERAWCIVVTGEELARMMASGDASLSRNPKADIDLFLRNNITEDESAKEMEESERKESEVNPFSIGLGGGIRERVMDPEEKKAPKEKGTHGAGISESTPRSRKLEREENIRADRGEPEPEKKPKSKKKSAKK